MECESCVSFIIQVNLNVYKLKLFLNIFIRFVPYCTSDSWSGTQSSPNDMFSFMGAEIVSQVVRDLVPLGLDNASSLFLAGSSAGGTGVMLNLDHVQHLVHHELELPRVAVRGVSDSGWFMDRAPYSDNGISPIDAVRKGMELWKARMPKHCAAKYPNEPWRCYFGYRLYPTLTGKSCMNEIK